MNDELLINFYLVKEPNLSHYILMTNETGSFTQAVGIGCIGEDKKLPPPDTELFSKLEKSLIENIENVFKIRQDFVNLVQFSYRLNFCRKYTQTGTAVSRKNKEKPGNFFIPRVTNIVPLEDEHIEYIQYVFAYHEYFNK